MSLLLVTNAPPTAEYVARGLREEGFAVRVIGNGSEALVQIGLEAFELVLLDWSLPAKTGLEILRAARERGDRTPVIMLTPRNDLADRLAALEAGADDCLARPFALNELLARARALLRRAPGRPGPMLRVGDLELDAGGHRVVRAGQMIRLTAREFALLRYLVEHAGSIMSRAEITDGVWGPRAEPSSNVVDVYIRYLRAKVDEPFATKLIHTVRMGGYVLRIGS